MGENTQPSGDAMLYADILKQLDSILTEIRRLMNPATPKQIRFIEDICDTLKIEKPQGFPNITFDVASDFISKHAQDFYRAKAEEEKRKKELPQGVRRQYF